MSTSSSRKRSRSPSWTKENEESSVRGGRAEGVDVSDGGSNSSRQPSSDQAASMCNKGDSTVSAVLLTTERLVSNIAAVSGEVVQAMLRQRHDTMSGTAAHTETVVQLYEALATAQTRRADEAVKSVALRQQVRERETTVDSLQRRLEGASREAVTSLWSRLQILLRGPLATLVTRLNAEQKLRDVLCDGVQQLSNTALTLLKSSERRALDAELLVAEQRVMLAQVQAAYHAERESTATHEQEMAALQRLVRLLANRVKSNEEDKAALARTKAHVRSLEKQLCLSDVVAALARPQETPAHSAATVTKEVPGCAASRTALGSSYDALRLLERRDMTIADLVQSWREQEERIAHNTAQQAELAKRVAQLQEDALVVHQRCVDEQRRRTLAERRVAELLRERLPAACEGGGAVDLTRELQELRGRYNAVCEDAAQLAVSLKVAREQQAHTEHTTAMLRRSLAQAKHDAMASDVARVVAAMRRQSQERWRDLRRRCIDAEAQCRIMTEVAEARGAALRQAEAALALAHRRIPQDVATEPPCRTARPSDDAVGATTEGAAEAQEALMRHTATLNTLLGTLDESRAARVRGEATSVQAFTAEITRLIDVVRAARPLIAGRADAERADSAPLLVQCVSRDEEHKLLRQIVTHALRFAVRQVAATDTERDALLETALADADCVQSLRRQLQESEARVVALQGELQCCQAFIERNHLTVAQDILQVTESPTAPSVGPENAEAADQLVVLQDELTGLRRLREEAAGQLGAMLERQRTLEDELREQRRLTSVAAAQAARVAAAMQSSHAEVIALRRQNVELCGQVAELARSAERDDVAGDETDVEAVTRYRGSLEAALVEFAAQLQTILPLLSRLQRDEAIAAGTTATLASDVVSEETAETQLALRVNRGGLRQVAFALQEAVATARLLQGTLREVALRDTVALADDEADEAGAPVEVRLAALQLRHDTLQAQLEADQAERKVMCERLVIAEELTSKAEEKSRRILDISKSLLDKQNRLMQENHDLRKQLVAAQSRSDVTAILPSPATPNETRTQTEIDAALDTTAQEASHKELANDAPA